MDTVQPGSGYNVLQSLRSLRTCITLTFAEEKMCFVLYIGTDEPLPTISWDKTNRHLNTEDLGENDRRVAKHFTKPQTKYLGSDQGCGCGFRHVTLQDGEWPEEWNIGPNPDYDGTKEDQIHHELFEFISPILDTLGTVELYGCWNGDFSEPVEHREEIVLDRLLDRKFFFRERGFYTITKSEPVASLNVAPRRE